MGPSVRPTGQRSDPWANRPIPQGPTDRPVGPTDRPMGPLRPPAGPTVRPVGPSHGPSGPASLPERGFRTKEGNEAGRVYPGFGLWAWSVLGEGEENGRAISSVRIENMRQTSITNLLQRWSTGDREAAEEALPLVYDELRRIAARELRRCRGGQTLQATALVHEVYLRLSGHEGFRLSSRTHFFALAATLIRQILVDHARRQNRLKRGGQAERVTLTETVGLVEPRAPDLLAVDEALKKLEKLDPRKAAIVELRFFAGLTLEETAEQLGISPETVSREWRRARAWLCNELESEP